MVIFTPDKRHTDMEQSFDLSPELAKQARYEAFLPRLAALIEGIDDEVAVLANTAAALREAFGFFWVGFYRAAGGELRLGPFQGTVACYRIRKGRGVCGTAFAEGRSIVVADVEQFPGHIACDSASRSEIVLPLHDPSGKIRAVLDIDSPVTCRFTGEDQKGLESLVPELEKIFS